MSNQKNIIALIKAISGQANVLTIPRLYVSLTKSHRAALLLSQCVYWSDKTKDPEGWFYKTFPNWQEELGMPRGAVETAMKVLNQWIETKVKRVGGHPKTHYKVNLDALETSISNMLETSTLEVSDSSTLKVLENSTLLHTEITTETTPEIARAPHSRAPDSEITFPKVTDEERAAIQKTFTEITGLHPPANKKEAGMRWWKPLRVMIQEANGQSESVLRASVKQMQKDGLTIEAPASVMKNFRASLGQRNLSGMKSATFCDPFASFNNMMTEKENLNENNH